MVAFTTSNIEAYLYVFVQYMVYSGCNKGGLTCQISQWLHHSSLIVLYSA